MRRHYLSEKKLDFLLQFFYFFSEFFDFQFNVFFLSHV